MLTKERLFIIVVMLGWALTLWLLLGKTAVLAYLFIVVFAILSERVGEWMFTKGNKKGGKK